MSEVLMINFRPETIVYCRSAGIEPNEKLVVGCGIPGLIFWAEIDQRFTQIAEHGECEPLPATFPPVWRRNGEQLPRLKSPDPPLSNDEIMTRFAVIGLGEKK